MAELFVLEFEGFEEGEYRKVNDLLGIDTDTGAGDWPTGLVSHAAGRTADGWMVVEVWDSRHDQEKFMNERLGKALGEAGVTKPPTKAEWTTLAAHHMPKQKAGASS